MRNDQLVRQHRIIERLRDGRARKVDHFDDIRTDAGVTRKTLERDLDAVARVTELQITTFESGGQLWYRSDAKPIVDPPKGRKTCSKCGEPKPVDDYSANRRNADSLENQCRQCRTDWRREWLDKNRTRVNARIRRWRKRKRGG